MSRNIKEIGKELLGKSLNSYHRRTGLTQLEENNKMQDGILDGILSQVDDAYIEKTEQSNVIHLDGSGDGVVVVDSIEGNTMVNIFNNITGTVSLDNVVSSYANNTLTYKAQSGFEGNIYPAFLGNLVTNYNLSTNKKYTFVFECNIQGAEFGLQGVKSNGQWVAGMTIKTIAKIGVNIIEFTTPNNLSEMNALKFRLYNSTTNDEHKFSNFQIYEGDISTLPNGYFKGIKSSFEEKLSDEDKYEIEILMKNKNLLDLKNPVNVGYTFAKMEGDKIVLNSSGVEGERISMAFPVYMKKGSTYRFSYSNIEGNSEILGSTLQMHPNLNANNQFGVSTKNPFTWDKDSGIYYARVYNMFIAGTVKANIQLEENSVATTYVEPKQNKIKLLLDEPLRAIDDIKDRLCIKDGKLVVERRCGEIVFDGSDDEIWDIISSNFVNHTKAITRNIPNLKGTDNYSLANSYCDKFIQLTESPNFTNDTQEYYAIGMSGAIEISINNSKLLSPNVNGIKKWLQQNPTKITYELKNPVYEEVLNEYGEPILLEGYENGTIYIDSTIVPTTTVRYTPKMESFKTLNEVSDNNTMLANDINDNIIPYMMDIDLMIMEKEMALPSQINIRKMEVLDMTSMQKRTQDMLERLIKGKTLTEQECKTRVAVYLNAGKITDEQAKELNFLIDEIYA